MNETLMNQAPSQFETERLLSDALTHGDKSKLADALGVSLSEISQQINPDEARKSYFYQFKRQLWALAGINPDAARLVYADLQASMTAWLGDFPAEDIGALTADVLKEAAELGAAQLGKLPAHVVRKEALEVGTAVGKVISACERQTGKLREAGR
jgi:DNA-binding transcriptional MocR family regulator